MEEGGSEDLSPVVLVQLSDLHLRDDGDGGPARRLEHAVRRVASLRPPVDAVLLSGDIVDVPSSAAYEQAQELLAPLRVPLHAIPGNHDDRDLLRACFGPSPAPAGTPVGFAVNYGPLRVVGCDSTRPGHEAGALGSERLDWLEHTLREQPLTPTLLVLHHPPILTGVRAMDAIALAVEDRLALEALLDAHPQVRTVTCGHVHTTITSAFAERALLVCPSTNSALRLDLRPSEDIPFATSHEPLGFAVHTFLDDRLLSYVLALEQLRET